MPVVIKGSIVPTCNRHVRPREERKPRNTMEDSGWEQANRHFHRPLKTPVFAPPRIRRVCWIIPPRTRDTRRQGRLFRFVVCREYRVSAGTGAAATTCASIREPAGGRGGGGRARPHSDRTGFKNGRSGYSGDTQCLSFVVVHTKSCSSLTTGPTPGRLTTSTDISTCHVEAAASRDCW